MISSGGEIGAAGDSQEKGRSVKMLVHHSRNSEQKQWDETLVLVLNGMGRLLRVFLPTLTELPRIAEAWDEIMNVVGTTMVRLPSSVLAFVAY